MMIQPETSPPDRSRTTSQKRDFTDMQNEAINEEVADEPFNAIEPEKITVMVENLCDKLTTPIRKYVSIDQRFQDLIIAADAVKKLPAIRKYNVAVLGEQGTGKSTVINALLDRGLLDQSGSSKACTAYATILEHKKGAPDDTPLSDVVVEFLTEGEIFDCINEQINLWAEVHPGRKKSSQVVHGEDESDPDESPATHSSSSKPATKTSRGAVTAKEFFQIIFDVQRHHQTGVWLEKELHHTDIREGKFLGACRQQALNRFAQLATEMRGLDIITRKVIFQNIQDRKLGKQTATIKKVWPFVKIVTIATGHILFRHGLRLFDLPGYGDMSQLREGVVNNFRRKADFEMVVAPCSRLQTSVLHDRYIDRSIHLKGTNKTILVMNKCDELINESTYGAQIGEIEDHPFPALNQRLEHIDMLSDQDDVDASIIAGLIDELLREVTIAYIKYETANVQRLMQPKGIKVFAVSAISHIQSKNKFRTVNPMIDEETAGIHSLRRFLAKLSTATNYRNYYDHVHEALPSFRNQAARLLEKHIEDKTYAAMRRGLKVQITALQNKLKILVENTLQSLVEKPWSGIEEQQIIMGIQRLMKDVWVHPHVYYTGFAKMLRENGIPMNGKYSGRNMNHELLGTMKAYHDNWYNIMNTKVIGFASSLHRAVKELLQSTRLAITKSSAHGDLKRRATEELVLVQQWIEKIYGTLITSLHVSLGETHVRFTTEIDIYCPIATEMKPRYTRAQDENLIGNGNGTYARQRMVLQQYIINPPGAVLRPLLKQIGEKMQTQQQEVWKTNCDTFIADTLEKVEDFSNTAEQLLSNPSYTSTEHRQARGKLRKLLIEFDISLEDIQELFQNAKAEHIEKKVKREETEDNNALAPPLSTDRTATIFGWT
ncbi:Dynamin N domain containing protein [Pyrenophora teres f. maculata]|nr:Dynamin N domain containing protein [Pyrenophora teres f. maculata]